MESGPRTTVAFVSRDIAAHHDLERRLNGRAALVGTGSIERLRRHLNLGALSSSDSIIIDLRGATPELQTATQHLLEVGRLSCRVLVIEPGGTHGTSDQTITRIQARRLAVTPDEPVAAYASAVHFGLGQHAVLIAAMRSLAPSLSPIGQRAMYEILGQRYECRNVNCLAEVFGMHRTRLHHALARAHDPTPKRLFDWCHTLVTALLMRHTDMHLREIARFVRARHMRAPREAVHRRTGMAVDQLRQLVERRTDDEILRRVLRGISSGRAA